VATVNITIGNQTIKFPLSGEDALWSPAIIDFAQAVSAQLSAIASPFDISPRVQTLTIDTNPALTIEDAVFPSGSVRSFSLSYSIYRTNGVDVLSEDGLVNGVYDTANSTWYLQHEFNGDKQSDGIPYHTFTMSGDQLQLTTVGIGGSYDSVNSTISYSATTLLISS
jgi:hypothetical protein